MEVEDYREKARPEDAGDDYKPEWETVVEEKTSEPLLAMVPRFCSSSWALMPTPLSDTVSVRPSVRKTWQKSSSRRSPSV